MQVRVADIITIARGVELPRRCRHCDEAVEVGAVSSWSLAVETYPKVATMTARRGAPVARMQS